MPRKPDQLQHLRDPPVLGGALELASDTQRQTDVLLYGFGIKQIEMLKDDADALPQAPQRLTIQVCDIGTFHPNTPGRGTLEQVDHPQQSALTGAGAADDSEDLALGDLQVNPTQGLEGASRSLVGFADGPDLDHSP